MTTKHMIELQPFSVPNFVRQVTRPGLRQDGFSETPGIPLAELDEDTLDEMCTEFRLAVFAKAGKVRTVTLGCDEKNPADKIVTSDAVLAGPSHVLLVEKTCPSCGASPVDHHVENYDPLWQDGDVICKCGARVRGYDAS